MRYACPWTVVLIMLFSAALLAAAACGETDEQDDEDKVCDQGYELVFEADAVWRDVEATYRYWLDENDADFLAGKVRDEQTGLEYPAIGETKGEGAYTVTFSPGSLYLHYLCNKPLSITLELKDLSGTVKVYCDINEFDRTATQARVECDDTGVSL